MTTIYEGTDGINLLLKDQVIRSVYRYGRSGKEILSIELLDLYIDSRNIIIYVSFRTIEMYGT